MHFDPAALKTEIDAADAKMQSDTFWDDNKAAQKLLKEQKIRKEKYNHYAALAQQVEDISVMLELLKEDYSPDESKQLEQEINILKDNVENFRLSILLTGEYDASNAILSLHAGAGGTEAQDWAEMLLRMYLRWADAKGFKTKIIDQLPGDVAGVKSVSMLVEGLNAYGFLKAERGVHRLVRISPFDSSGRRHTSFASLDVMPEIDDEVDVVIADDDIRVDTFRASGAGGQHVNKTDSAIRITHLPTGIVVQCQNERSQHQNRETAMKMLKGKLIEIMESEQKEKIDDLKGDYTQIAWGSQIRSYVFQPYTMVKDHRTNAEMGNITAVMDGDIDPFINAYLKNNAE